LAWTLRVTADAALLAAAVWRVAGMPPTRLLGNRGGRAAAAVAALVAAAATGAALASDAATRAVVVGVVAAAFVVGVWRFVLNDVERTGLRRVLA
jgi:hypothetical protein